MKKDKYERIKIKIIEFQTEDVITTSSVDEYEGWNPHNPGGSGEEYEGWNPY